MGLPGSINIVSYDENNKADPNFQITRFHLQINDLTEKLNFEEEALKPISSKHHVMFQQNNDSEQM